MYARSRGYSPVPFLLGVPYLVERIRLELIWLGSCKEPPGTHAHAP